MRISQGEIWLVEFYPQVGSEIAKLRPAVVISHDSVGKLPLKTVVPITDWKPNYRHYPWMIGIDPDTTNGLTKRSAIDCFQVKSFADKRFQEPLGHIEREQLRTIHETIVQTFDPLYGLTR